MLVSFLEGISGAKLLWVSGRVLHILNLGMPFPQTLNLHWLDECILGQGLSVGHPKVRCGVCVGWKYYPAMWALFCKPWNEDPVIKQPVQPIVSMHGMFTYIWLIFAGNELVNIDWHHPGCFPGMVMELPNGSNCLVLSENDEANKPGSPKSSGKRNTRRRNTPEKLPPWKLAYPLKNDGCSDVFPIEIVPFLGDIR